MGPTATQEGSAPEFLRKHMTTFDFPGKVPIPCPPPPPSGSAHDYLHLRCMKNLKWACTQDLGTYLIIEAA